jgi:hypothetical protein
MISTDMEFFRNHTLTHLIPTIPRAPGHPPRVVQRSRTWDSQRLATLKMYGESFEIVSDPFTEGDCIAVHAISRNDSKIRTLRLPIATLLDLGDRFSKQQT